LGYPHRVVDATLEKLRSLNFLNDELFARNWARGRVEDRGYGPLRIERQLREKGIAKPLIAEIIAEIFGQEGGKQEARRMLERRFRGKDLSDRKMLRRAIAFLQRRGYRDSVIAGVLKMPLED